MEYLEIRVDGASSAGQPAHYNPRGGVHSKPFFPAAGDIPRRVVPRRSSGGILMSKGMDQKREQKRKPAKTLEEKRAAKKAKKAERQGR
jgi:hypothetical protein